MATTIYEQLIQQLIKYPEQEVVEFKHNNSDPKKMGSWMSGLANSACLENKPFGYLIYGISDDRKIVGTHLRPHEDKVGHEAILHWITNRLDSKIDFRVQEINIKNKDVVLFEIPAVTVQPLRFDRVAYVRVGSSTRRLDELPDKERKIWKNTERYVFETNIAANNLTDDEVLTSLDFSAYFELFRTPPTFEKKKVIERFIAEQFVVSSGDSKFSITNLGAILFGRDLTKFDHLDRKRPRIIVYKGKNRIETLKEKSSKKGYAIGFEKMIFYINDQLPMHEEIGKVFRKEVRMYPELAIRELVANAIPPRLFHLRNRPFNRNFQG